MLKIKDVSWARSGCSVPDTQFFAGKVGFAGKVEILPLFQVNDTCNTLSKPSGSILFLMPFFKCFL